MSAFFLASVCKYCSSFATSAHLLEGKDEGGVCVCALECAAQLDRCFRREPTGMKHEWILIWFHSYEDPANLEQMHCFHSTLPPSSP